MYASSGTSEQAVKSWRPMPGSPPGFYQVGTASLVRLYARCATAMIDTSRVTSPALPRASTTPNVTNRLWAVSEKEGVDHNDASLQHRHVLDSLLVNKHCNPDNNNHCRRGRAVDPFTKITSIAFQQFKKAWRQSRFATDAGQPPTPVACCRIC